MKPPEARGGPGRQRVGGLPERTGPRPPVRVSLVLGSGGARGLAHIGVIRWLTENGYEVCSVSGSSMGALIGGIHAQRKLEMYADWVQRLKRPQVIGLLDPVLGRPGLFKGDRIIGVLRELLGDSRIEDLPTVFTAVATDLDTGEEVWLRQGRVFDAIRASIATPLVFTPVRLGGRLLLDGALVNPLPVSATVGDDTDLTIAVSLNGAPGAGRGSGELLSAGSQVASAAGRGLLVRRRRTLPAAPPQPGLIEIALLSMQAMYDTIGRLKLTAHAPDVTIEIPRDACGFHEFWRAEEMIALGRDSAARALPGRGGSASSPADPEL